MLTFKEAKMKIIGFFFLLVLSAAQAFAAPINVSCTDSIKTLNKLYIGSLTIVCPVNCTSGSVWGTHNQFTTDSAICVAAMHEGVITHDGGWVKVKMGPGHSSYVGDTKNGVLTQSWGAYDSSFSVSK